MAWAGAAATLGVALIIPRLTHRARTGPWTPSVVDERICTGCNQCPQDCPWEAITMRARSDGRETLVAHVNPSLCVSCGICAGSCAPMGVGPPLRTGRDQIAAIRQLVRGLGPRDGGHILAVVCDNAPPDHVVALGRAGATLHHLSCTGNLHTSAIELALRGAVAGVIVYSCPPRDCRGREGPKWLGQRVYHDREAELQPRVERRRVRLATAAAGDLSGTLASFQAFARDVHALGLTSAESLEEVEVACEPLPAGPAGDKP
jgi:ferredoxin